MRKLALPLAFVFSTACLPPLRPPSALDGGAPDASVPTPKVVLLEVWDGGGRAMVDATNDQLWLLIDFETESDVEGGPWDIGLSRFQIKSNGGISGDGGVEIVSVLRRFEDVAEVPSTGFLVDAVDGNDEGTLPDYVFHSPEPWFAYEPRYHSLSPRPITFVVHTVERNFYKVAVDGFYDRVGTSGFVTLRWSRLPAPNDSVRGDTGVLTGGPVLLLETWAGGGRALVDATDRDGWRLIDLDTSSAVDAGPWDIGLSQSLIKSNGGISGPGGVTVAPVMRAFDAVTAAPDGGFFVDAADGDDDDTLPDYAFLSPEPWFTYATDTRALVPRPMTFVVRTVEQRVYKVAIDGFYDGAGVPGVVTLRWTLLETP